MNDFISFVCRGALAGSIFPLLFLIFHFGPRYGPLFFLGVIFWYLAPGAMVGLVMWVCGQVANKPGAILRITIGTAISFPVNASLNFSDLVVVIRSLLDMTFDDILWGLVRILLFCVAIGGVAGFVCPAEKTSKKEPELSYWERLRLYEAAEAEAKLAREKLKLRRN
jgi:hypothetical protein